MHFKNWSPRRHVLWQLEVLRAALDMEWRTEASLLERVARPLDQQVWWLLNMLVKHGYAERRWRPRPGRGAAEREWRRIDPPAGEG